MDSLFFSKFMASFSFSPPYLIKSAAPKKCPRLTIGFDLDETLLCTFTEAMLSKEDFAAYKLRAEVELKTLPFLQRRVFYLYDKQLEFNHIIVLRPGVRQLLENLQKENDLFIYTASGESYATAMTLLLFHVETKLRDPVVLMERMHCFSLPGQKITSSTKIEHLQISKPLQNVVQIMPHLHLEDILLVDNRQENGVYNPSNFVLVPDFTPSTKNDYGSSDEYMINRLPPILEKMLSIEFYNERCNAALKHYTSANPVQFKLLHEQLSDAKHSVAVTRHKRKSSELLLE
jgi:hypothetical protein